jgi:acetylornithine aminotransferase
MGRTGKWMAHQWSGIKPDVITLAKGLASGVPVGACVTGGRAKGVFKPGNHGSTFGGNPLAMTGVVATIDIVKEEGLIERAAKTGELIRAELRKQNLSGIADIRGMGSMIGVELARPCGELVLQALEAGLVLNVTADNVVRMLPPLVMNDAEARMVVERLAPLLKAFLEKRAAA